MIRRLQEKFSEAGWTSKIRLNLPTKLLILDSCEFGEDAALKAYDMALKSDAEMDAELRKTILEQQESIKASHDRIKMQRDLSANLDKAK